MDDKTKDLLRQLKTYFDEMDATHEGFDDTSRLWLMCYGQVISLSAHLVPTPKTDELLEAAQTMMQAFLEVSSMVKLTKPPVKASDAVT